MKQDRPGWQGVGAVSAIGSNAMKLRRLVAVAVVVVGIPAVGFAQHGGGGHVGSGGFHGGGGGTFHGGGGVYGGGFSRSMGRVGGGGYAPNYARQYGQAGRGFAGGGVGTNGRPAFYHRGGDRRRAYGVGYGVGVGYGYGEYGWLDANDPGYDPAYDGGYDSGSEDNGYYDVGLAPDGSGVEADGSGPQEQGYAGQTADDAERPVPYAPPARGRRSVAAQPTLYNSDAVTLVFKDGRPSEKIHNYALTRTTLYVTDGRREEIPVALLDLAATEKANRAAGVPFDLPVLR